MSSCQPNIQRCSMWKPSPCPIQKNRKSEFRYRRCNSPISITTSYMRNSCKLKQYFCEIHYQSYEEKSSCNFTNLDMKKIVVVFLLLFSVTHSFSQTRLETCIQNMVAFYDAKNYDKSIEYATEALTLDPKDYRIWGQRGLCYQQKQDFQKALADMNKSVELKPDDETSHANRAVLKITMKDLQGAYDDYNTLWIQTSKKYYFFQMATVKMEMGKADEAEKDFRTCISWNVNVYWCHIYIGQINQFLRKDYKKAIENYNQAIDDDPVKGEPWARKGDCYVILRDEFNAHKSYKEFAKWDSKNPLAHCLVAQMDLADTYTLLVENGFKDRYEEAVYHLNQALLIDSTYFRAKLGLIQVQIHKGEYDLAVKNLEVLEKKYPAERTEILVEKGFPLFKTKGFDVAIECLNQAVASDPKRFNAWLQRAKVNVLHADYVQALSDLEKALSLDSISPQALYYKGQAYYYLEQYELSEKYLNLSRVYEGINVGDAYQLLAKIQQKKNNYEKTLSAYKEATNRGYVNKEFLTDFGNLYLSKGDTFHAMEQFSAIINDKEMGPTPEAWCGMGRCYLIEKNWKEAAKAFNQALALNSSHAASYLGLGMTQVEMKKNKLALESFNKAIELDNQLADAYLQRGLLNLTLKDHVKACSDFNQANELGSPEASKQMNLNCK